MESGTETDFLFITLDFKEYIFFKFKLKIVLSLNNTVCDNYTHKQTGNKENIKSTFSSKC